MPFLRGIIDYLV